ncbi:MAG: FtsK/SpoIIIE domain-containing protein [Pirellulaceae bacterium]|nr:hypothetical protein [Planctomycetales bacterium]
MNIRVTEPAMRLEARCNPFSSARVRPAVMNYVHRADESTADIVLQFEQQGSWGAIIGAHGSGKTTLLQTLVCQLDARDTPAFLLRIGPGGEFMLSNHEEMQDLPRGGVLAVDGYDELNWFRRWRLSRKCRRRGWGLLVTSHRDIRIPTLIRTSVSRMQAITIVKELTEEWPVDWSVQAARQVDSLLEEHDGNMREVLFALYDRFDEFCRSEVGDIRVA